MAYGSRSLGRRLHIWFLFVGSAAVLSGGAAVRSDSLYVAGKSRSMFADRRARAVGDVVTVLITESTVAIQDADSSAQRSLTARADGGTGLYGILKLVPKATLSGSVSHKGSGSTTRTSKLASTITCRVAAL